MNAAFSLVGENHGKFVSHYSDSHYNKLVELLTHDCSVESKELLAGLYFVVTGDSGYLIIDDDEI